MATDLDSHIVSELDEEVVAYFNPICAFLGVKLPDPTKLITRIGPNEFKAYSERLLADTFAGEYIGPSDDLHERPTFYFDQILPLIERHARSYKCAILGKMNEKVLFQPSIYEYGGPKLQDFFLEWQEDLIKYLRKIRSVIDAWNDLYFVKYEARPTLKVPKDKTERREFFDSVPLCKLRFYKLGKQAIIENMVWYTLLQRDHEKALNRISALYFWITILGFICFAFIFIYFN